MSPHHEPFIRRGIGLLGGTFDPVHNGHLSLAREALSQLHLARVDFVPAANPWQKTGVSAAEKRLRLLQAGIEGEPLLRINPIELLRSGPTYTIDTLKALRDEIGPSVPLILILGADQWNNLHTWKDWSEFTSYCHLAVANRDATTPSACDEVNRHMASLSVDPWRLTETAYGRCTFFTIPAHAASSTKIRETFLAHPRYEALKRLEHWLPMRVAHAIARYHLY